MPSSLAAQLAKGVSLNAPILSETQRKKHFALSSYLFSTSTKSQIDDLDSIHALAESALLQLRLLVPESETFNPNSPTYRSLFSQHARDTDRTLLTKDGQAELDTAIQTCLRSLGPCLLESQAGRVIEWLVRRFRINEFNVRDILSAFVPYHESPHFAKMVSIMAVDVNAPWSFLSGYKSSGSSLQRSALVTEMLRNTELARFVFAILPNTISMDVQCAHRALANFNTATVFEFMARAGKKHFDASTMAFVIPALTGPLGIDKGQDLAKDVILGSFILLSALSQKCSLTQQAISAVALKMIHATSGSQAIEPYQLFTALISFLNPQQGVDAFPAKYAKEITLLQDYEKAVKRCLAWKGADKLLVPLLPGLLDIQEYEILDTIVTSTTVPATVVKSLGQLLLTRDDEKSMQLLSSIYQRHLDLLQLSNDDVEGTDSRLVLEVEKKLTNLTATAFTENNAKGIIINSNNVDASVRVSSVRAMSQLFEDMAQPLDDEERESLGQALLARIFDGSASVLDALYANARPIAQLIHGTPNLIHELSTSLIEQGLSRSILRSHLNFFANAYIEFYPEDMPQVMSFMIFPFFLATKPRAKTASAVWEVVFNSRLGGMPVMSGLKEIVKVSEEGNSHMNGQIAMQFVGNTKDTPPLELDSLLMLATDEVDSHGRLFAWLILRHLYSSLSTENQLLVMHKLFGASVISNIIDVGSTGMDLAFDEDSLQKSIFSKPSSLATTVKAQLSFLSAVLATTNSSGKKIQWMSTPHVKNSHVDLLKIYYTVISNILPPKDNNSNPVVALFSTLGPDVLLFLAEIWTGPPHLATIDADTASYLALRHALAFILARTESDQLEDLQVVIPALLMPLQSQDQQIREAAIQCFAALLALSEKGKPKAVYAYDEIYGEASEKLQYLDWNDEVEFLKALLSSADYLVNDASALPSLFSDILSPAKSSGKKDLKQRRRILSFFLSHIARCGRRNLQMSILKALERVSDALKMQIISPLIQRELEGVKSDSQEFSALLIAVIDKSAARDLNDDSSSIWPALMNTFDAPNSPIKEQPVWARFSSILAGGLFDSLSLKRQMEFGMRLLEVGIKGENELGVKDVLRNCLNKPRLISDMLKSILLDLKDPGERQPKKAKTNVSSLLEGRILSRLAFLMEVLTSAKLPGSFELVTDFIDALSRIMSVTLDVADSDVVYVEQLLMSCVELCVSQIKELPNLTPNAIRFDVLVELLRTSDSPQTFQQALMLIASLARLSPSSILVHVMPIFTFMGSNVFHRDDGYSFKVIQKTMDHIVPVAVASLRREHADHQALMINSRTLLRTFTDAHNHIPRHRRTNFFCHLVAVLDPADFLAPVSMLLAEKSSNRVAKQDPAEAQTSLALPLSVMQRYDNITRLNALREILNEVKKLFRTSISDSMDEELFLDQPILEEHTLSPQILRRRQCQTLLVFVGLAMKQITQTAGSEKESSVLRDIVSSLLDPSLRDSEPEKSGLQPIVAASRWTLMQTMGTLTVDFFMTTCSAVLSEGNTTTVRGALELLAARVPVMDVQARKSPSLIMSKIIALVIDVAAKSQEVPVIAEAMSALLAIGKSAQPEEESALSAAVPVVLDTTKKYPDLREAVSAICMLSTKLGPRVIAHLSNIIETCVSSITSTQADSRKASLDTLFGVVKSVPSFWAARDVSRIFDMCLSDSILDAQRAEMEKLVKFMAKQLPSKTLLSALLQSWPAIQGLATQNVYSRLGRFFDMLKKCLHHIARADILASLRPLGDHFIETLNLRQNANVANVSELEDKVIASFVELVVKLNETAFQPLFRKMCDGAFGESTILSSKITFCRIYYCLLDLFKELMSPYMSLLHSHLVELLQAFAKGEIQDSDLWVSAIQMLSRSFAVDDGVFWHDTRIKPLIAPLVSQLTLPLVCKHASSRENLSNALSGLLECIEDDSLIKDVNLKVLMHTRSDDVRVRLAAVQCATAMWSAQGSQLRGFASETAAFIVECAEDENDEVVRACRQLRDAVETVSGRIEGL